MRIIKLKYFVVLFALLSIGTVSSLADEPVSLRKERQLITEGNKLFKDGKFADAAKKYEQAIGVNPSSAVGKFNLGISQIKQVTNPKDTTQRNRNLLDLASKNLQAVSQLVKDKPDLAAKAAYNLGNLAFNTDQFGEAVEFYKESLRIKPEDDTTRRNLRIAQKKLQNQNKDQNQDQNKDNKDQKQDQKQDQQKQNQNQDQQNQDQQKQQPQKDISQQTADQILKAVDNKESQTRQKFNVTKGDKSKERNRNTKNW